jgi:hypothetical protein
MKQSKVPGGKWFGASVLFHVEDDLKSGDRPFPKKWKPKPPSRRLKN